MKVIFKNVVKRANTKEDRFNTEKSIMLEANIYIVMNY